MPIVQLDAKPVLLSTYISQQNAAEPPAIYEASVTASFDVSPLQPRLSGAYHGLCIDTLNETHHWYNPRIDCNINYVQVPTQNLGNFAYILLLVGGLNLISSLAYSDRPKIRFQI